MLTTALPSRPWILSFALAMLCTSTASAEVSRRITIRGADQDQGETPIVTELRPPMPPGAYLLTPTGAGPALRANVFADGGKTYLGLILDGRKQDEATTYSLRSDPRPGPGVEMKREGGNVRIAVNGELLTVYRTDAGPKPVLFPLIGPTGAAMTRSYPMEQVAGEDHDHPHQRSFWFTHGNVNGVDFWSESPQHGSIRETGKVSVVGGAAVGVLRTTDDWLGPDGKTVCEDERVLRVYATKTARVLDFEVTVKATAGPVTFGDTKEGTFGLRLASSLDANRKPGGTITNAEGRTNADAWGKPSPWVDYAGPVAGKAVGVAILNHPDSFRFPTAWHVRDYGLFAANPFGLRDFGRPERGDQAIPAGGSIVFRYRVILHEGPTAAAGLPRAFRAYAKPPRIETAPE